MVDQDVLHWIVAGKRRGIDCWLWWCCFLVVGWCRLLPVMVLKNMTGRDLLASVMVIWGKACPSFPEDGLLFSWVVRTHTLWSMCAGANKRQNGAWARTAGKNTVAPYVWWGNGLFRCLNFLSVIIALYAQGVETSPLHHLLSLIVLQRGNVQLIIL